MAEDPHAPASRKFRLPLAAPAGTTRKALPPALRSPTSRGSAVDAIPLLEGVKVVATYELAAVSRSLEAPESLAQNLGQALLALEAEDGSTVFIRADRLGEVLERLHPDAVTGEGELDLALFRDAAGQSRGGPGGWLWKRLSILELEPDSILDAAQDQAREWLGEQLAGRLGREALYRVSWQGAKALMGAIEAKLAGEPGLYHWGGGALATADLCRRGDERLKHLDTQPGLIFLHGTGSHTLGSFGDLGGGDWKSLEDVFGERIFGFEHRTFSESPIDNALALLETLPDNARFSLVSHSRGGLVGDLLCLGGNTAEIRRLIDGYRRLPRPDEQEAEAADPELAGLREQVADQERDKLLRLVELLEKKAPRIERYVRVACPAAGTALLSDNLEVFMSGLLTLVRKLGAWGAGAAVGTLATPLAGKVAKDATDQILKLLGRVVLEIADKRLEAHRVPGIEAMLPEAPLGAFLARADRAKEVRMAVIAGDIEGGGLFKRIGVLFTDWMFFDRAENDLVVDTASMYAGLVARNGAHALFDQGEAVNHFSYFRNPRTGNALRNWLLDDAPGERLGWLELPAPRQETREAVARRSRGGVETAPDNARPVVILLPGIMGSHLEVKRKPGPPGSGDRVWLDVPDLALGGLRKVRRSTDQVEAEALLDLAYGDLARHLEASHRVIPCPYDWRLDILTSAADRLAETVTTALAAHPDQPVRLLAHSMGGLVARAMIARHPALWEDLVRRPGGRLVMLGTPNHGSHLMVETLLGKSTTIRMLGRMDLAQPLQSVLDIVAGFPGALQLLPQPGFTDTGGPAMEDFFDAGTWPKLAQGNDDFWFGKTLGGKPVKSDLTSAQAFWDLVGNGDGQAKPIPHPERIAYVFGQADNTPCGIRRLPSGAITMLGSPQGDGSVTWASGRLAWLPEDQCWFMPADHMGLANTGKYFDDIAELLATGKARRLGRLPKSRSGEATATVTPYQPGPLPGYPGEADLVTSLVGGHSRRIPLPRSTRTRLSVGARAMDLRFLAIPVLCGHYVDDAISGPERTIDEALVNRALSHRQNLGVHAGAVGTTSVVLMPRSARDVQLGIGRGAVVVGLGELGQLSSRDITETVRSGVLRFLLHADDRCLENLPANPDDPPRQLKLASLLMGYNSTTSISLEESVKAVTLGVLEANRQFAQDRHGPGTKRAKAERAPLQVTRLEFVELFQDAAITAATAITALLKILERDLKRLGMGIEPEDELRFGPGVRTRLSLSAQAGYWPRLIITDADGSPSPCAAECYEIRQASPIPPDTLRHLLATHGCTGSAGAPATGAAPAPAIHHATHIKYTYLGQRARAETVVQQRQPGLVEGLVKDLVRNTRHVPETGIGNTLFHLLVPPDFKAAAREASNLLLVLDPATANIPWEMLEMDGKPLVLDTRIVRQLAARDYRRHPRVTRDPSALLVVNPSTRGYRSQFGGPDWQSRRKEKEGEDRLPDLPGSVAEADAVHELLRGRNYQVTLAPSDSEAGDIFGKLFERPYRILMISAHGVHQVQARDGSWRSGVVLSDGLLLSAAEIGLMETVPELVFLNCCHLGKMDADSAGTLGSHRLAYSLARELIEMGARGVVASGWEVDDAAGRTFAETFFQQMLEAGAPFGQAIYEARRETHDQHPGYNTWGAYQAYGDPDYRLDLPDIGEGDPSTLLAPNELLEWLDRRRLNLLAPGQDTATPDMARTEQALDRKLRNCPAAWRDRPDILQALGLLYGAHGPTGFAKARTALARAIAEESRNGVVALDSIQQLADLEARHGAHLGMQGQGSEALELVDSAIQRLDELLRVTRPGPPSAPHFDQSPRDRPHAERQVLLGNAHTEKARLLILQGQDWPAVNGVLTAARDACRAGEGRVGETGFSPAAMIIRLQLNALLDQEEPDLDRVVDQCRDIAGQRFDESLAFADGVLAGDAELAPLLYPKADLEGISALYETYRDAVKGLPTGNRNFASTAARLCLLATLVHARGQEMDRQRAVLLADLAQRLDPLSPACPFAPGQGVGDPPPAPAGSGRRRPRPGKTSPTTRKPT